MVYLRYFVTKYVDNVCLHSRIISSDFELLIQQTRPGKQTVPVHLNLATKVFRGKHTKVTIKRWIEEVRMSKDL